MDVVKEVVAAEERIRPHIRETILDYSPFFSKITGADVYFKLENLQYTGSFKVRGAINKVLSLTPTERRRGVVTASTGNHGMTFISPYNDPQVIGGQGTIAIELARQLEKDRLAGKQVVVVLCGANISIQTLKEIL
jgi:threonine dehydratase